MMSISHPNICETIAPILAFARWTGVMPLTQCKKSGKHANEQQCIFKVSTFWSIFSIIIQMLFIPFMTILVIDLCVGFGTSGVLWNSMKVMFIIHEIELYAILILGVAQAKYMSKILNKLSKMPSTPEDLKWISKFLKLILTTLMLFFSLYSSTRVIHIWLDRDTIEVFRIKNFSRCIVGLILHNYLTIFTQVQCLVSVMLCLLINSKFNYLTNLIQVSFDKTTFPFVTENKYQTVLVKTANTTLSAVNKNNSLQIDTAFLEGLHHKYCEITDCLDEINSRIGFQLLMSISVILYSLIFFLFCEITVADYNSDKILVFASIFGTCVLIIRLTLYMWIGFKVKQQTGGPLNALQHSKIIHQPQQIQQQIQSLLLQWSSSEPGYLTAFNIMNVGPWLLTSIIGNIITYLLVFIQISKSTGE